MVHFITYIKISLQSFSFSIILFSCFQFSFKFSRSFMAHWLKGTIKIACWIHMYMEQNPDIRLLQVVTLLSVWFVGLPTQTLICSIKTPCLLFAMLLTIFLQTYFCCSDSQYLSSVMLYQDTNRLFLLRSLHIISPISLQ